VGWQPPSPPSQTGAEDVLIIERDVELGGILQQCIHNGFGLEIFKQDLPGPAYAQRFINEALAIGVETLLDTMVLDITRSGASLPPAKRPVLSISRRARGAGDGLPRAHPRPDPPARHAPGGASTPPARPSAGSTWKATCPASAFVVLGSGDIGMIMARRLTLEGAKVEARAGDHALPDRPDAQLRPVPAGFDIPLQLSHTVRASSASKRVEAIESVRVDERWNPVPGTEEIIPCDTLLLSVGLIPENELSRRPGC
jgi:hypothetical protein